MKKIKIVLLTLIITCMSIIPISAQNVHGDSYFFDNSETEALEVLTSDFYKRFNINVDILIDFELNPGTDLATSANNHYQENYGSSDGIVFAFNGSTEAYVNTFGNAGQYVDPSLDLKALISEKSAHKKAYNIQYILHQMRLKIENQTPSKSVVDLAGLLSAEQTNLLQQKITNLIDVHKLDIAVVTTYLNNKSVQDFADDYYDHNNYGLNDSKDGVMLVMDMYKREWHITTTGKAINVFSNSGLDYIGNEMMPKLKDGNYYNGFVTFTDYVDQFVKEYETSGVAFEANKSNDLSSGDDKTSENMDKIEFSFGERVFCSILLGFIFAVIICFVRLRKLKTKKTVYNANNYLKEDTVKITKNDDMFLYSTTRKKRREEPEPKEDNKKGSSFKGSSETKKSGSSTHRSSSGQEHGGRGGKF